VRTCVGCRLRAVTGELLRLAVVDGDLVLDLRRRVAGRGAWLHPDLDCLAKAERRRAFVRALRVPGPLDVGMVRAQLEQHAHAGTDAGVSGVRQEDRKQVDPS
jgi:uncharacterized protein